MIGRVLCAAVFVVLLPAALMLWARGTEGAIAWHAPAWPGAGGPIALVGLILMVLGMRDLIVRGGGLPMNAFPPTRLVTSGVYRIVPHPIYVGFVLVVAGLSLTVGSKSGVFLVSPCVALACAALVVGYEGPATRRRFRGAAARPVIRAPDLGTGAPTIRDRVACWLVLLLPWALLYEAVGHIGVRPLGFSWLPGEAAWLVWPWTTLAYSLAYPLTLAAPWLAPRRSTLRRFFVAGWVATCVSMLIYLTVPIVAPPRPFDAEAFGSWLLRVERADGLDGRCAFPAFHVIWSVLAAATIARRGRRWAGGAWILAAIISASCLTTGMHSLLDVAAALPLAMLAWHHRRVRRRLLRVAERVANSWREWRVGPVRVISHAFIAGGAAVIGTLVVEAAGGGGWPLVGVALGALAGAALWGQLMAGGSGLLRPFGYFGALLGAAAMLLVLCGVEGANEFWRLAGGLSVAAPWVVLIGRLRCLVQGCCHGHPVGAGRGIRYRHPRSRVCTLTRWTGVPMHPTPLYSMLANAVVGLVLMRMWMVGAAVSLVAGLYLILAGATRFVEEGTRGEPQTCIVGGLRVYQWLAIASIVAGAAVTTLPAPSAAGWSALDWAGGLRAAVIGAAYFAAMGVDMPGSNRRFARLA